MPDPQVVKTHFHKMMQARLENRNPNRDIYTRVHTSTKALYLLSILEVMWTASEWKGELSPTNIRERHCSFRSPSLMSGLLPDKKNVGIPDQKVEAHEVVSKQMAPT